MTYNFYNCLQHHFIKKCVSYNLSQIHDYKSFSLHCILFFIINHWFTRARVCVCVFVRRQKHFFSYMKTALPLWILHWANRGTYSVNIHNFHKKNSHSQCNWFFFFFEIFFCKNLESYLKKEKIKLYNTSPQNLYIIL